jgi:hypothetical protein
MLNRKKKRNLNETNNKRKKSKSIENKETYIV